MYKIVEETDCIVNKLVVRIFIEFPLRFKYTYWLYSVTDENVLIPQKHMYLIFRTFQVWLPKTALFRIP